ncbi:MAG: Pregnancy-associated plasma protein-A [Chitinophagaceae bacterium]|nr:Pregnancy-associated plasma protein-A [Chitinophagaceae bacterium]
MKARFLLWGLFFLCAKQLVAQRRCASLQYAQQAIRVDPSLQTRQQNMEKFIQSRLKNPPYNTSNSRPALSTIRIPVIVHIVYHQQEENISDEAVANQLAALNRDYQRKNADSSHTPDVFKAVAGDCKIEFELAKVDPQGRVTNGIERIYSPITKWVIDGDKVKFKVEYGADSWDARFYMNIWVCNLDDLLGYSSVPGEDEKKDGIVINYTVFNDLNDGAPFNSGRTAVHETGHWLSLKHLWGDADCGSDEVTDTPPQAGFTSGCPGGLRISCGNSPNGDMYMNFMDYTNDPCMNLFTNGQRDRMRTLFEPGGLRNSLLSSKALDLPWLDEIRLPDDSPQWLYLKLYPNPVQKELVLDFRYDPRWIGQEFTIVNVAGQVVKRHVITSKVDAINISSLSPGIYIIHGNKDGVKLVRKFIKM